MMKDGHDVVKDECSVLSKLGLSTTQVGEYEAVEARFKLGVTLGKAHLMDCHLDNVSRNRALVSACVLKCLALCVVAHCHVNLSEPGSEIMVNGTVGSGEHVISLRIICATNRCCVHDSQSIHFSDDLVGGGTVGPYDVASLKPLVVHPFNHVVPLGYDHAPTLDLIASLLVVCVDDSEPSGVALEDSGDDECGPFDNGGEVVCRVVVIDLIHEGAGVGPAESTTDGVMTGAMSGVNIIPLMVVSAEVRSTTDVEIIRWRSCVTLDPPNELTW
jgi:hypothetical protein